VICKEEKEVVLCFLLTRSYEGERPGKGKGQYAVAKCAQVRYEHIAHQGEEKAAARR